MLSFVGLVIASFVGPFQAQTQMRPVFGFGESTGQGSGSPVPTLNRFTWIGSQEKRSYLLDTLLAVTSWSSISAPSSFSLRQHLSPPGPGAGRDGCHAFASGATDDHAGVIRRGPGEFGRLAAITLPLGEPRTRTSAVRVEHAARYHLLLRRGRQRR
jgi:hypothetical protein